MARGLDDLDRRIPCELQADATLSIADLASRVSLFADPCWKRILKLGRWASSSAASPFSIPKALAPAWLCWSPSKPGAFRGMAQGLHGKKSPPCRRVLDLYRMVGETDMNCA